MVVYRRVYSLARRLEDAAANRRLVATLVEDGRERFEAQCVELLWEAEAFGCRRFVGQYWAIDCTICSAGLTHT